MWRREISALFIYYNFDKWTYPSKSLVILTPFDFTPFDCSTHNYIHNLYIYLPFIPNQDFQRQLIINVYLNAKNLNYQFFPRLGTELINVCIKLFFPRQNSNDVMLDFIMMLCSTLYIARYSYIYDLCFNYSPHNRWLREQLVFVSTLNKTTNLSTFLERYIGIIDYRGMIKG